MGRFALELFEGPTLIERVRFDFPLLGVPDEEGGVSLTRKLRTRIGALFPATKRGTRLELWDRASNRRWSLPWPAEPPAAVADAGAIHSAAPRALAPVRAPARARVPVVGDGGARHD
jgi:hypothetical protein